MNRPSVSPLTVNRLSIYLRCLEELEREGLERVSSTELAARFHLSASQIRKDLAHLGELGTRGVGYPVAALVGRLRCELGLDRRHGLVIVGIGNLGSALAAFPGFHSDGFRIVGLFDSDRSKTGRRVGRLEIRPTGELPELVRKTGTVLGVLTVPAEAAQRTHDLLVDAGIRAILNFAPRRLSSPPGVRVKNVDLRINLEELSFFLVRMNDDE